MNYYTSIKNELINNEVYKKVKDYSKNKSDLRTYYNVGKMLSEAGKHYGEGIIKEYSKRLTSELGKGYTQTRLRYFRRFYEVFSKCPTLSDKLSFSHYCEMIWFETSKINYYIDIVQNNNLSVRQLRQKIKNKEYERLSEETKEKLKHNEKLEIGNTIKNEIVIYSNKELNSEDISEKALQNIILDNMGSDELIANLFRISQTNQKLINDNISGENNANNTHYEVGKIVRRAIREAGGTMPEDLPKPDKSLKELEKDNKLLDNKNNE